MNVLPKKKVCSGASAIPPAKRGEILHFVGDPRRSLGLLGEGKAAPSLREKHAYDAGKYLLHLLIFSDSCISHEEMRMVFLTAGNFLHGCLVEFRDQLG